MISKSTIENVKEADIVKVIQHYYELKQSGSVYKCKSPFTEEKTPSFVVSPSKNIFKCFSTGIGGDAIEFVMKHDRVEFIDAIKTIANICGIIIEEEQLTEDVKRKKNIETSLQTLSKKVADIFRNQYHVLPEDHWAKAMLNQRGFTKETIIDFQIGFADNLNTITKEVKQQALLGPAVDLGVVKSKANSSYDFFRDRIMFPIYNHNGKVVAFGGRQQNGESFDKTFKYINSPESDIYKKDQILYGLHLAKRAITKSKNVVITEGYTDVIGLHQNGCEVAVATCGTALSRKHATLLKRFCNHAILMRDGDKAGLNATIKDIDILLQEGFKVSVILLPEGEDPDSFSKNHDNINQFIAQNIKDALIWKTKHLASNFTKDNFLFERDSINETAKTNIQTLESDKRTDAEINEMSSSDKKTAKQYNKGIQLEIDNIIKERDKKINSLQKIDPYKKELGVDKTASSLLLINSETLQAEYIKTLSKALDVSTKDLKLRVAAKQKERQKRLESAAGKGKETVQSLGLPKGADVDFYLKYRFCVVGSQYYFEKNNSFIPGTTFSINPLYHIKGRKENKRLCELRNVENKKELVDFDSESFVSFGDFRKQLIRIGNFMFLSGTNSTHFDLLAQKIMGEFNSALELQTMGWNNQGFFAFANGVYYQDKFREVNKYGIIHLPGVDKSEEDEYTEKIEHLYSPAFSVMHRKNQEGDDPYENDRKFVYRKSPITLKQWMDQMVLVFEDKGQIGILFNFATLFRDLFLKHYDFFPLLGGFGEKGSGKSAFGKVLQNFFFYGLDAFELNSSTLVGFSRRLTRTKNVTVFLDEYHDKIEDKMIQGLKGAHQGMGREKGMMSNDNRTKTDKINSSIYIAGQYVPTVDDNSLQSRLISLIFPLSNKTTQQRDNFNVLMNWSNQGLSSLIVEIVENREHFEKSLSATYSEVANQLKTDLDNTPYEERIFGNYAVLLITYKILKSKLPFPFSYETIYDQCLIGIIENSESISYSNGMSDFWNIVQFLFEANRVRANDDFKIEKTLDFKILKSKGVQETVQNKTQKRILFLRLKSVYQYYVKEASVRENTSPIGEVTLKNYFHSRPYFIGLVKGKRFANTVSSCYAFDYDMMQKQDIVSLHALAAEMPTPSTPEVPQTIDQEPVDEIPF